MQLDVRTCCWHVTEQKLHKMAGHLFSPWDFRTYLHPKDMICKCSGYFQRRWILICWLWWRWNVSCIIIFTHFGWQNISFSGFYPPNVFYIIQHGWTQITLVSSDSYYTFTHCQYVIRNCTFWTKELMSFPKLYKYFVTFGLKVEKTKKEMNVTSYAIQSYIITRKLEKHYSLQRNVFQQWNTSRYNPVWQYNSNMQDTYRINFGTLATVSGGQSCFIILICIRVTMRSILQFLLTFVVGQ